MNEKQLQQTEKQLYIEEKLEQLLILSLDIKREIKQYKNKYNEFPLYNIADFLKDNGII